MAYWVKMEKRKVTEMRDGAIYRTEKVGDEWFLNTEAPEAYVVGSDGVQWCNTSDMHFGKDKPTQ